jgi:lysophospholipid acyltransferase (LPLAT)-like uncharacterized protein
VGYRVDTVPWPLRPPYLAVTWTLGLLFYLYYAVCRFTSRVSVEGPGRHDLSQHAIFCMWHESWWSYFVVFVRYPAPHVAINHPAAYMKPVHVVFRLMGLRRLILGSSGEEGQRAANELAQLVRDGYSTTISPDGPYGPARVLKKGVLHVAMQSGVPIVPLTIACARGVPVQSWDSKRFPLPFNRFTVTVHEPVHVTRENFDEAGTRVVEALATGERSAQAFALRPQTSPTTTWPRNDAPEDVVRRLRPSDRREA